MKYYIYNKDMKTKFVASNGKVIKGKYFKALLNEVANDWENIAYDIRKQDNYASHVTEKEKDEYLSQGLKLAEKIRQGEELSFTILQRINLKVTGKCVALLP